MPSPPQQPQPAPAPAPAQQSGQTPASRTGDEMPSSNELFDIAAKSLQTGALAGTLGAAIGAGSGIMRNAPPTLFALFAGFQWFALGSSFMASRSLLWHAWGGEENLSSGDKVKAGAVAGGVSGMVGGMARGPSNILPGIFFFSTLAGTSTFIAQKFQNKEPKEKTSWMASKWSPMKQLTDQEYEKILEERLLRLNAEIAVVDDNIASLKGTTANATAAPSTTAPPAKSPESVVPEPDDKPKVKARSLRWWSS